MYSPIDPACPASWRLHVSPASDVWRMANAWGGSSTATHPVVGVTKSTAASWGGRELPFGDDGSDRWNPTLGLRYANPATAIVSTDAAMTAVARAIRERFECDESSSTGSLPARGQLSPVAARRR